MGNSMQTDDRLELVRDGLLTVRQAEDLTGLKKSKLYDLMNCGELTYAKIGAARRIPRKALFELLAKSLVIRTN